MSINKIDAAGVIIFPPLLYLVTIVLSIVISFLFPFKIVNWQAALLISVPILILAFLILTNAVNELLKIKTTIDPRGSTTNITKNGIYKYSRNPMYLSFTLFFIAICILFNSWIGLSLIFPLLIIVNKGIIEKEEKYLTVKFGKDYLQYKSKVSRWF